MSQDRLSRTWLGRDAWAQVVCVFAWRMTVRHLSPWEHAQASQSESRADCAVLEHDFHPHYVQLRRHTFPPLPLTYVADSNGMPGRRVTLCLSHCPEALSWSTSLCRTKKKLVWTSETNYLWFRLHRLKTPVYFYWFMSHFVVKC